MEVYFTMAKSITKQSLNKQAQEIIKLAEAGGVQSNYFFVTTFRKYQTQEEHLEYLKCHVAKTIDDPDNDVDVRQGIIEYNRAVDSANKTLGALLKIIKAFDVCAGGDDDDPLMSVINGSGRNGI